MEGFTPEELMISEILLERGEFIDLWDDFTSVVTDEKLAECFSLRWFIYPFIICIEISD